MNPILMLRWAQMRIRKAVEKYIKFADPAVEQVLIANGVSSDDVGITTADVEGVTSIGTWFKGNTDITSFDEFEKFTGVTKFDRATSNTASTNGEFNNCANLVSIKLPSTLINMGFGAFHGCSALKYVGGLSNVEAINSRTFYGCTSLAIDDLALPNLTSLGLNAFYGVKIKKISNLGKITEIVNVNATSNMLFGDRDSLEEVVLPNTLLTIGNYAFAYYTKAKISLSQSITNVQNLAFFRCESMDIDVVLPNLTTLGDAAFRMSGITKVSDLGSIAKIAGGTNIESTGTFNKCLSLSYVNIPSSVTSIEGYAFRGCSSLTTLVVGNSTPPSLASTAFTATPIASGTGFIYVPDDSVDAYKVATNWAQFSDVIKPKSELNG